MALVRHPREDLQYDSRLPQGRGPIYNIPIEILHKFFNPFTSSPRTRDDVYTILELTHVCHFWRIALNNKPQAWATIYATRADRRGFVEACLEKSRLVLLKVEVDAYDQGPVYSLCTCDKDQRPRLIPNEIYPCEQHFVFESLTKTEHWKRIETLKIRCGRADPFDENQVQLALESCRFFNLPPPQLANLKWYNRDIRYANPWRTVIDHGPWHSQFMRLDHLTSLVLMDSCISTKSIQTFMLNNQSLEKLSLVENRFEGQPNGPPVELPNLKSLNVNFPHDSFSHLFRVPALQRLSSLSISVMDDGDPYTFRATGDEIVLTFEYNFNLIAETWEELTGYAKPTIRHICLANPYGLDFGTDDPENREVLSLFLDAQTLEIGRGYAKLYRGFLRDLKRLGPQLEIIRFEIPRGIRPYLELGDERGWWTDGLLDFIEDLVIYRFERGRPLSSVERMVVSKNEEVNRELDLWWKSFYDDRHLDRYLLHG